MAGPLTKQDVNSMKLVDLRALIPGITFDLGRTSLQVIALEECGATDPSFQVGKVIFLIVVF